MTIHQLTPRIKLLEFQDLKPLLDVSLIVGLIEEEDAVYLIDSGLGPDQLEPVLKDIDKPVHLILTHSHWDHIWGAQAITGDIYGHRLFEEEMSERMLKKFKKYKRGVTELVKPNILVDDEMKVGDLTLFYTPGHTRCSISIWDPIDQVIFVGDTLFTVYRNENLTKEHLESLYKYRALPFKYLVPGHIGPMDRDDLERIIAKLEKESQA